MKKQFEGDIGEIMGADVKAILEGEELPGEKVDVPVIETTEEKKKKRKRGAVYVVISYFFVLIFVSLIGYMIYFNVKLRDDVMRSPYNKRQDAMAEYVLRGEIRSSDGTVLARTQTGEDGKDYRVYPEANVFAHVIGYDTNGKSGVESIANYELLTSNISIIDQVVNDFTGNKNPGDTVVTTLDADLQKTVYNALGSLNGAAVAIDPVTGKILAMVSRPDFDPNLIRTNWNDIINEEGSSVLVNRATQGRYAPGSTFKIITALAYRRAYGDTDSFTFHCTGELEAGGNAIHCAGGAVHGDESFEDAFANSCNCAFAQMGLLAGPDALRRAAEDVLFNKELPLASLTGNKSSFSLAYDSDEFLVMQTSFGQGKTLTNPYHMALIAAAAANDGVLMKPYVIDRVESTTGTLISQNTPEEYRRLLTPTESSFLRSIMKNAVENGTASALSGQSYAAFGKTGTAEYLRQDGTTGTHSWFVGYAEKDGKKIAVAILAEDGGSGSDTAVPAAKSIFNKYYE